MHRLQQDKVWVGIVVSLFITITFYYFFYSMNNYLSNKVIAGRVFYGVRERFVAILSVFFNIIPFLVYIRAKKDHAMHGVGIVTVVLALIVVIYYFI